MDIEDMYGEINKNRINDGGIWFLDLTNIDRISLSVASNVTIDRIRKTEKDLKKLHQYLIDNNGSVSEIALVNEQLQVVIAVRQKYEAIENELMQEYDEKKKNEVIEEIMNLRKEDEKVRKSRELVDLAREHYDAGTLIPEEP